MTHAEARAKRLFDLALAVPLLVIAAVPMALVALALWLADGAPVLFRQLSKKKAPCLCTELFS